ncbi:MAG TPA: LuxR C-terminal-related transcriptional regulator [Candidatus Dormibacteraeota bacterium]|nr:LuxR C-terminal-related transcriptional regulator [Candidatus Dormibacteraeota bacterium]
MRTQRSGRGLHNVPAELTSFVGRRRELAEIKERLRASRLVTLTGPGGVGKTRLALRAATELARAFPDGVWLVELAAIEDPPLVTQAVFHALGLQDRSAGWSLSALTDYLGEKHLLLILDNCEHLLDTCAVLASTLLKSCPQLRVLATSRQAIGVSGEVRMRVPSLTLPEADTPKARLIQNFEAVALLAERATAVLVNFRVDESNAADVLRLCRRLDGIPLALELAAGRLEGLSVNELNQALDREPSVLGGTDRAADPRQQTLDATIEWSYRLLDEHERRLWARLSVFAGSFDQEAALLVCSGPDLPPERIVGLLGALVEKSLLKRELSTRSGRYQLLETLRQHGRQRLRELGDEVELQARHRDWILGLAGAVGAWDSHQAAMFSRIYVERDNLWAALDFCLRQPGEAGKGAEICRHLFPYWLSRGPITDARRVLVNLLERTPDDSLSRAQLLWVAATLAPAQNDYAGAGVMSGESLRIGRLLGDSEVVAWSLMYLAISRGVEGKTAEAVELAESALSLAREMQVQRLVLGAMTIVCGIRLAVGDLDGVIKLGDEADGISVKLGELWARGYVLNFLSQARWQQGDLERAEVQAQEAGACQHALGDRLGLAIVVETLAWMSAGSSAYERAATLLGCAERLRQSVATPLLAQFQAQHERSASSAKEQLGERAFAAAFELGRAFPVDEAVAYALGRKNSDEPQPAAIPEAPIQLTNREQEIARLVAEGLTNKQIAGKLVISERTAESHIVNILNKLGFNSRTQIASWASAHQPLAAAPKG